MKIIKQDGNIRLVKTIGNYMEGRYEIQEKYSYYKHNDDESPNISWAMRCYSHDLKQAYEMYERARIEQEGRYNMKLKDVIERLADNVEIEVVIDDYENISAIYYNNDMEHIEEYLNCSVETIDTTEDGILVLVVDGNTGEEKEE